MSSKPVLAEVRPFAYDEFSGQVAAGSVDGASREARARADGHAQGLAEARTTAQQQLDEHRLALLEAIRDFEQQRQTYYQQIETEVVQLALAIARKILHRESQVDPLMLAGIVKVTLEKLQAGTQVRVRVHPHAAAEWRHFFSCRMESRALPEVVEDPALTPERCVLETSLGQTELGVEVQLKEIEQGLADLLAHRPGPSA